VQAFECRCWIHHEGTKGTKGLLGKEGALDPDNIKRVLVAPLPDALRDPSHLRGLRAFVVNPAPEPIKEAAWQTTWSA
jgi:hypothetical protein